MQFFLEYIVNYTLDSVLLHISNRIKTVHSVSITDGFTVICLISIAIFYRGRAWLDWCINLPLIKPVVHKVAIYVLSRLK